MTKPHDRDEGAAPPPEPAAGPTRRVFLQASAAMAGATLLSSCLSGGDNEESPLVGDAPDYFSNIKHLVVVMFENRSFDNLLGYLYSQGPTPANWPAASPMPPAVPPAPGGSPQSFEGIWQFPGIPPAKCEGGAGCNDHDGRTVLAYPYPSGTWDFPPQDPYEPWEHVRLQVFHVDRALEPTDKPDMSGFLWSYADRIAKDTLTDPPDPALIMGCYTPEQLPVLSTLARNFAVFDHWHCAVPSQTYCNRAFFHASTSYGYVTNAPWTKWMTADPGTGQGTIFDALERHWRATSPPPKVAPWAVYFTGAIDPEVYADASGPSAKSVTDYVGLTGLIHYDVGRKYGPADYPEKIAGNPQRFFPFEQFFCDVAAGTLPQYTFLEPLGGSLPFALPAPENKGHDFHPPGDVRNGEEVVRQIYEAIRTSGANGGHDYTQDTMLLVVFDEHGGTYDHVKPPKAVPPDKSTPEYPDCTFDWLGVRVPAIAISSYTLPGTIVDREMHHAAVIKTLFKMNPGAGSYLTERDRPATVADLGVACNGERSALSTGPAPWPALGGQAIATCAAPKSPAG